MFVIDKYFIEKFLKKYNFNKIVIFGAGERGRRGLKVLKSIGFEVICFCDNDEEKKFKIIDEVICYPPADLPNEAASCVFIISPQNSDSIYEDFSKKYEYVLPAKVLDYFTSLPFMYNNFYPIGHYYSLYPDLEDIEGRYNELYSPIKPIRGIDLNEMEQIDMLKNLSQYYNSIPEWKSCNDDQESGYRYRYNNPSLSSGDAIVLHCMLRYIKPKRIIEVGSGWSSAVMLDTNQYYFKNSIEMTFIEPYPRRLKSILKDTDDVRLIESKLELVNIEEFQTLEEGDILFIDSTHVSKSGSDVNHLFFEILPLLNRGVFIHLHDIFDGFEYPMEWIKNGMVWNELYLLRAFLQYNNNYKTIFFHNMLQKKYPELLLEKWPLMKDGLASINGGSFWMKKI